jgi:hypothetical protein
MRPTSLRVWLLAAGVLSGLAAALAASPRTFDLPDHGTLSLAVPDPWQDELRQPPNRLPPTVVLSPRSGAPFQVLMTAVWPIGATAGRIDDAAIRAEVAAAAKEAEPQSVERALAIQELAGVNGRGFYFSATDKAPRPGEYRYLTQGIVRTGEIALAFTVLTNDGQESVLKAALEMLRTASHRPAGAV